MDEVTEMLMGIDSATVKRYVEFDESDAEMLAMKILEANGGDKQMAVIDCQFMAMKAAASGDRTTINGCNVAHRYMLQHRWPINCVDPANDPATFQHTLAEAKTE